MNTQLAVLLLVGVVSCLSLQAAEVLDLASNRTEISKGDPPSIQFYFRLREPNKIDRVECLQGEGPVDSRFIPFGNDPMDTVGLLLLVDSSQGTKDQPREATFGLIKSFLLNLVDKCGARHTLGLYQFGNDLKEAAPLGSSLDSVRTAIRQLKPTELGTRLHRRAMDAVEILAKTNVRRKALLLITDGKEEDTGYSYADLLDAARKANVIVHVLGCPERDQDVPILGSLEKLSAELGGIYDQLAPAATKQRVFDSSFSDRVITAMDSGGQVVANLDKDKLAEPMTFRLYSGGGLLTEYVYKLDNTNKEEASVTAQNGTEPQREDDALSVEATPASSPQQRQPPTEAANHAKAWDMIAFEWVQAHPTYAAAGGVGLLAVVCLIVFKPRKNPSIPLSDGGIPVSDLQAPTTLEVSPNSAWAYVEVQDAHSSRIPLIRTAVRIGRRPDNDIVFGNDSISGYHAEIHLQRDNSCIITDLASGNGVFLNGRRVNQSALKEGDLVEMGEVRFRFIPAQKYAAPFPQSRTNS